MFTLAIVGRPNVGKSTLFNRLVGKKLALVHDTPGLTRDWRDAQAELWDLAFRVIDTAGLEEHFDASIEGRMRRQTEAALKQADMALLVIDARAGVTPLDRHFAEFLRRQGVKTVLVANKCESKKGLDGLYEAYELGLGEPVAVSAEHGHGMEDLCDLLRPHVEAATPPPPEEDADTQDFDETHYHEGAQTGFGDGEAPQEDPRKPVRIAIIGRPNAGKSTLLNRLLGEERSMTGPEAGITRDSVHADWEYEGRALRLVDTAGLRRRNRVTDEIEKMSAADALRAIRLAQVAILMTDATDPLTHQDLAIASHVVEEGRALVVAVNKWDLVEKKEEALDDMRHALEASLSQVHGVPLVPLSALTGKNAQKLVQAALAAYDTWNARVPTGKLNRWLAAMEARHPAPLAAGRPNRLRYITQVKARPPTFALWVSRPADYPDAHKRYLVNNLRRDFGIPGTPVRVIVKASKNPYVD